MYVLTVNRVEVLFQNGISSYVGKLGFFVWRPICVTRHAVVVHIVMIVIETLLTKNFSPVFGEVA